MEDNNETMSSPEKDQEKDKDSANSTDKNRPQGNLFAYRSERDTWQVVRRGQHSTTSREVAHERGGGGCNKINASETPRGKPSRRVQTHPSDAQKREGNEGAFSGRGDRGRGSRGKRGRGSGAFRGGHQGRGGPGHQAGAVPRQRRDPVSLGFTQPDIRYERNKLYILGLHFRSTRDAVKNYIERISGYDVDRVEWFKPNGKAIVTLNTDRIADFARIIQESKDRKLEGVIVTIERAPECKSIFVSGFSENTTKEQVEEYFDRWGSLEYVAFSPWDENGKEKRAIVYFKEKKSVKKSTKKDHFIHGKALHVETFFPFMGTLLPVNEPSKSSRPTSSEVGGTWQPQFYKAVDKDIVEFLMKSNQEAKLKGRLHSSEHAGVRWTNDEGYLLVKYDITASKRVDKEFDEEAWKKRCSDIIDHFIDDSTTKEFPVDREIWEAVVDQLPKPENLLPKFTAQVKLLKESHTVKLICQKTNMPEFAEILARRLKNIKTDELEKNLDQKTLTDITIEKLQLLLNCGFENILKKEFDQDLQLKIDLSNKNLLIKTPKGHMQSVLTYLRQRLDEIDQNALSQPPEILEILKTKVGKRKMTQKLPDGCAFNVDEKSKKVILLGKTLSHTCEGRKKTETLLLDDRSLKVTETDNDLLLSPKWDELCKKLVKRLTIRQKRELDCIAVFGFKSDVEEAVKKMRDFRNEKKATEGEFRLDSPIYRKFFTDYYKEELQKIEEELVPCSVKISLDESGERIKYCGTDDGVKEAEERIYILQDQIKEKSFPIQTPGMRNFMAQDAGRRLVDTVERENKCIISIAEESEEQIEDEMEESDNDEPWSISSGGEEELDDVDTFFTKEGKKVIWKSGNIEEEQADILVCSVGSKFNLTIGAIANAISKAAGPELQEELRKKTTGGTLGEGDIVHTGAGNLDCRHVIHCVCCPWKRRPQDEQLLKDLLRKCFDKASELGACSIGLPLVGTGNLNFPYATAVQIMIQAAVDYSHANPESPLEEIRYVVFSSDQNGIATFEEKFEEFKKENRPDVKPRKPQIRKSKLKPVPPEFEYKEVQIGDLSLKVLKGDITKERSDAICNVISQDLNMKSGTLSSAILAARGSTVEDELQSQAPQPPGDIVTTSAGYLSAIHIIHMVVGQRTKKCLQTCVEKALNKVDALGLKSVSIPAVGTGGLGQTAEESAQVVFGAIRVSTAKPFNSIREVRVVVFDVSFICAYLAELNAIQKETSESSPCGEEDDDLTYYGKNAESSAEEVRRKRRRQKIIYYGRLESFDAVNAALKDGVIKACGDPRVIKREVISRLSKRAIRELKQMSRMRDVKLDQPEPGTIRLQGLPKDVMDMNSELSNAIQEHVEREHRQELAEQMSKTVQWYLVNTRGQHVPFDKMANNEIESAFKAKKPSLLFTHQNLKAEINFGNDEVTFLRTGAIKRVLRRDVLPLPDEWDPQPRDVNGKEETLHLVSLEKESKEYKKVEDKFLQTMRGKAVITNIERIQNPSMHNSYMVRKQTMYAKNGTIDNELELFHGTKVECIKAINVQGFDRSLCGANGNAFGDGVYFAKDASYSITYSTPDANGNRFMYLAGVLVGKYTVGKQGWKKPPAKDLSKSEILFDSLVNKEESPTIFVVFNDFHVYPKYLISFK
ncbi:poly [ADP-ribose] polymerase 14-like [Stylophora pistillata]|uniref:poly [ADP-ribose] polymerase 14-like n=1 Tax=Stylophora pistillata TaxID=50429 RepID=UPI000C03CABC|nr:poly [ADP-ribose] polymerase 14-like [Stylophora pistillata]